MKTILILLLAATPALLFAQDCEKFKEGTFYVKDDLGNRIPDYVIIRKKGKQIEKAEGGIIKTKVVWTSACTYELIHIKSDIIDLPKGTVTTVKIVGTFDGGYEGVGTSELAEKPVRFIMYKVD